MAINFCRPLHSPKICCSGVSADDFEVENLISSEEKHLRNGFRAESFVRPPVEITLTFPVSIDISHIVLGLKNGTQQTTAIRIFTKFCKSDNDIEKFDFKLIGKFENMTSPIVCLKNNRFRQNKKLLEMYHQTVPPCLDFQSNDVRRLLPRTDAEVCCVRQLKICLLKVANSGVVVLSKLQVWGQPARDYSTDWINRIVNSAKCTKKATKPPVSKEASLTVTPSTGDVHTEDNVVVPEEFLDSLTQEIMSLPMVLPSGNVVDQHTLEKCSKMQAVYGRIAIDPFTGIPFHGENQPIFNAALKARIDEFIILKGNNTLNVPRTIGMMRSPLQSWRKSNLCSTICSNSETVAGTSAPVLENSADNITKSFSNLKRKFKGSENDSKKKRLSMDSCTSPSVTHVNSEEARKERLRKDIQEVLGSCKRYTNFTETIVTESKQCTVCSCEISDSMFQLPCSHVLCRSCLVTKTKIKPASCSICNKGFTSGDATRVFS